MSDSLLVALQKYSSRPSSNPIENFTTEAFTWLLRNDKGAEKAFLELIKEKSTNKFSIDSFEGLKTENQYWQTQVRNDGGTADIVGRFNGFTIVVEVKVWSGGAEDQLQNYVHAFKKMHNQSVIGVYLTADYGQHKKADCSLLWEDVYTKLQKTDENKENWKVQEFLEFLDSQGLSPRKPISYAAWRYSGDVLNMVAQLDKDFGKVKTTLDEKKNKEEQEGKNKFLSRIYNTFGCNYYTKNGGEMCWGRTGIRFKRASTGNDHWNPAFFVGLVLDPRNHCYEQIFDKGVIFSLVVDVGSLYWDRLYGTEVWANFTKELEEKAVEKGWLFYSHNLEQGNRRAKKWHPVAVYKPMFDIVLDCKEHEDNLINLLVANAEELIELFAETGYQKVIDYLDASGEQLKKD